MSEKTKSASSAADPKRLAEARAKGDQLERHELHRAAHAGADLVPVSSAAVSAAAVASADAESAALARERARRRAEGEAVARVRDAASAEGAPSFIPTGPEPAIVERARARGFRTAAEMLESDVAELRARIDARERGEVLDAPSAAFTKLEERIGAVESFVKGAVEAFEARVAQLEGEHAESRRRK